jgi:GNAT superfamily N-acetyltransferase
MSRLNDFQIRTMRREELAFAIDLAAREGWDPGLHDAECFFSADPGGFLIGELVGEPVGCISAVSYAGRYGFVGLYIVRPEFRGQDYGLRLWQAALAQQSNYALSGFRLAYPSVRSRGRAEPAAIHGSVGAAAHAPQGEVIFVDVPEANPGTKSFLATLSLTPVIELPKLFGVTTF